MNENSEASGRQGLAMALCAYGLWGVFPIYWKQVGSVPAAEVLAHRVFWSLVFVAMLVAWRRSGTVVREILNDAPRRNAMLLSTTLIAINWGIFIWAVSVDRVAEASLGYYINPLLNVALAKIFLGETLRRGQAIAVALAATAVVYLATMGDGVPWVSLVLAITFALYGLVRKRAPVGAADGLAIECGVAAPFALIYLLSLDPPMGHLTTEAPYVVVFLVGSGVATALPLLAFAGAARRLRYTTLGMIQYLAPTLQLACAVWLYGEPFGAKRALAFGLIWCAVAIYMADSWRARRLVAVATR